MLIYITLPIHRDSQRYLPFMWRNKHYQFTASLWPKFSAHSFHQTIETASRLDSRTGNSPDRLFRRLSVIPLQNNCKSSQTNFDRHTPIVGAEDFGIGYEKSHTIANYHFIRLYVIVEHCFLFQYIAY